MDYLDAISKVLNKEILSIKMINSGHRDKLCISFPNEPVENIVLKIYDNMRLCCEKRYMVCDDDLDYYIGSIFLGLEIDDGPIINDKDSGKSHTQQFLVISTNKGQFTVCTHNINNGYYGGFLLKAEI